MVKRQALKYDKFSNDNNKKISMTKIIHNDKGDLEL